VGVNKTLVTLTEGCTSLCSTDHAPRPRQIEVSITEKAGDAVIQLKGEATFTQARALEAGLLALSAWWPRRVTLDLSELTFLSSLALGVLVEFRRGVVRAGGCVRVAPNLQPQVREALEAAKLFELFDPATCARLP
jgi:anti-anti-sigma factor